jgi:hypothetical protein
MPEKEQLTEGGELWNFIHSSRNTFSTDGHLGMARRAQEILDKFTIQSNVSSETPREVLDCTREYGHSGPCNGWPCAYVRKNWILVETMECPVLKPRS